MFVSLNPGISNILPVKRLQFSQRNLTRKNQNSCDTFEKSSGTETAPSFGHAVKNRNDATLPLAAAAYMAKANLKKIYEKLENRDLTNEQRKYFNKLEAYYNKMIGLCSCIDPKTLMLNRQIHEGKTIGEWQRFVKLHKILKKQQEETPNLLPDDLDLYPPDSLAEFIPEKKWHRAF